MKYFMRTASVCQIIFLEMVAISCTASVFATILSMFNLFGCAAPIKITLYLIAATILGIICWYAVLKGIIYPTVGKESFRPVLKISRLMIPNPFLGASKYFFPSTNPSYVFADIVAILFGAFFFWVGNNPPSIKGCVFEYNYLFGYFTISLPFLFPIIRLISWYILKRKLSAEESKKAWVPVAYFWGIVTSVLLLILLLAKFSWK